MHVKLDDENYIAESLWLTNGEYPEDFFEAGELSEPIEEYKYIDGGFIHAPRDLDPPTQEETNGLNREYLADTDWYLLRKFETGVAVPQEVLIKRQEAREAIIED